MANSDEDRDGRSSLARGYVIASQATSIGFQMVIPSVIGWWVDGLLNTLPVFLILGTVLGFALAMYELVRMANRKS